MQNTFGAISRSRITQRHECSCVSECCVTLRTVSSRVCRVSKRTLIDLLRSRAHEQEKEKVFEMVNTVWSEMRVEIRNGTRCPRSHLLVKGLAQPAASSALHERGQDRATHTRPFCSFFHTCRTLTTPSYDTIRVSDCCSGVWHLVRCELVLPLLPCVGRAVVRALQG